jgi:hypothetical protein
MKEDIDFPKVEDIIVTVVRESDKGFEDEWNVYLVNLKPIKLTGILVSSRGYGADTLSGEKIKTSTMRHFIEEVTPRSFVKIEQIIEDVFALTNEYWVSFYLGSKIYDKKFIFLAESIKEDNFIQIPILNKKGVMIR